MWILARCSSTTWEQVKHVYDSDMHRLDWWYDLGDAIQGFYGYSRAVVVTTLIQTGAGTAVPTLVGNVITSSDSLYAGAIDEFGYSYFSDGSSTPTIYKVMEDNNIVAAGPVKQTCKANLRSLITSYLLHAICGPTPTSK
jgi:hypothetical protein